MDFSGLLQKIMGGNLGAGAGAPMDIRPPAAGGAPLPTGPMPPPAPTGPSIFDRLGAGIQSAAKSMGGDSPMGGAASAFTAARGATGGPSLFGPKPMVPPMAGAPGAPGAPMDIRPPVAGGAPLPSGPSASDMGGMMEKIALLLGSI